MSIVVVNQGETAMLTLITDVDMTLRLYKTDVTAGLTVEQIEALDETDLVEADFAGYTAVSMTTAWTLTAGNPSEATRAAVTFTRSSTGTVQDIYGYWVTRNSDGALMWFERFPAPVPVEFQNDAVTVTPKLTLDDDTGRSRVDTQIFTSSGTWTKPAGLKAIMVELVGGGGSGGGTAATGAGEAAEPGGGGAGGYSRKLIQADDLGATVSVTVGAGAAAAAAGGAGNAGGSTSFGSHCSATGGGGGSAGSNMAGTATSGAGAGGTGSSGDINTVGQQGSLGLVVSGVPVRHNHGGSSALSESARSPQAAGTGNAGLTYGGGSSGAVAGASTAAQASTAGAAGVVIVTEFF